MQLCSSRCSLDNFHIREVKSHVLCTLKDISALYYQTLNVLTLAARSMTGLLGYVVDKWE